MCRVAITRRASSTSQDLFQQLNTVASANADIDISLIFEDDEAKLQQDLDFLSIFKNEPVIDTSTEEDEAVLGTPVINQSSEDHPAAQIVPVDITLPTEQSQQHLPAPMIYSTQLITPEQLHQQYTQAIIQQQMLAQLQSTAMAAPRRRGRTDEEIAEQQERIKKRRRESAQRSRQRKSAYMKTLECENHALKIENEKLRKELARLGTQAASPVFCAGGSTTTSGSSPIAKTESPPDGSHSSDGAVDDRCGLSEELNAHDGPAALGMHAVEEFMGMVLV